MCQLPFAVLDRAPLGFRAAKWLQRNGLRGGYRLEEYMRSKGWSNVRVRYALSTRVSI